MSTSQDDLATGPDIAVGTAQGYPLVQINRFPENITTGREMAATIVEAMNQLVPEHVHADYDPGYDGE